MQAAEIRSPARERGFIVTSEPRPPICDYEGSDYRTRFWEGKGRDYEDRAERAALRSLLPEQGLRLLEIGAGYGRLTNEYHRYQQIVLLDYSLSQLRHAQSQLGRIPRFTYVAADAYRLPFQPGVFDGATMIRVIHHMANVPLVLAQIRRVMASGGTFILEYANKRNLKAVLRRALRRQSWSPHTLEPVEFIELNFNFHPEYIRRALIDAAFVPLAHRPVSFLRVPLLKRCVPVALLTAVDAALQSTGLLYAPSIFVKARADGAPSAPADGEITALFACPECGSPLEQRENMLICVRDGLRYAIRDGIYDFKAPLNEP
jgi:SAM-dependent methyltransferase